VTPFGAVQRQGVVDVNEIISKMPAMLDAEKQLKKLSETYDAEYKTMAEEYQAKLEEYKKQHTDLYQKFIQLADGPEVFKRAIQ
jgi:Skp family chaperone for outer membrane proteins